jgi:hypothetical protein
MTGQTITIPASWDIPYIIEEAGLTFGYGIGAPVNDAVTISFYGADYDRTLEVVSAYPTSYLSRARPKALRAISSERDRRIKNFEFMGFRLDLEGDAKRDLADAAFGLVRNPDVAGIDWSIGGGEFIFIPRDQLLAIADAAFKHVQSSFSGHRRMATKAKNATTTMALDQIDPKDEDTWNPPANSNAPAS